MWDESQFMPGLYVHYKGGIYTAAGIVYHHETKEPYVLVTSHDYGTPTIRPLYGLPNDPDGFLDEVDVPDGANQVIRKRRFQYVGRFPSDDRARERVEQAKKLRRIL